MAYLLGLDIGTTGARAVLVDERGRVLNSSTSEYPLSAPQPLWSEQNPADWWQAARQVLRAVVAEAGVDKSAVAALGLTGQMHGAVFLDRGDQVIRPAILWNDQRTARECEEISHLVGADRLIEIAGNPALTGFQAPKILWLRNHEPEAYQQVRRVLLPKDYVRLMLTGASATDASDAAGTLLLDLRRRDWSADLLSALDIPPDWLPQVFEGPEVTAALMPEVARDLDLPPGLPVVAGGGDNAAAAVGTGIIRSGVVSSSIGTSGVLFAHSESVALDPKGRLHTFCHAVPHKYHLMAVTLSAGGSFRWLRDMIHTTIQGFTGIVDIDLSYGKLTDRAAQIPPGAEGLIFLPYLTGERTPHLDPLARGAFVGLTSRHTLIHLARAVMEGVVFSLKEGLEIMRQLGLSVEQIRATGGGGRSPLWRQIQADIFGAEIASLAVEEGPAYGAALLAGVGAAVFESVEAAVDRSVAVRGSTQPDPAAQETYARLYETYQALYPALQPSLHALSANSG